MTPSLLRTWKVAALALALGLSGCTDFSRHTFGGVRRSADAEEGVPKPGPTLAIPNPPAVAKAPFDGQVKQATLMPDRNPPVEANPQATEQPLRALYQRAAQQHAKMDSYIFRLKRSEVVGGKRLPEELMQVKIRYQPYSVYLKWLSAEGKGREVVYVHGKFNNEMQVLLAPSDFGSSLFKRQSVAPDSAMVRDKCRNSITQTGLGAMIDHFGRVIAGFEKGDPREGTVKYLGPLDRPEFTDKVVCVLQNLPPGGSDPLLPKGGRRWWFFDVASGLPVLRITHDPAGEVEYYCHDHIQWPVRLDEDDFNPDRLWRK
jgi:hypothetical protein